MKPCKIWILSLVCCFVFLNEAEAKKLKWKPKTKFKKLIKIMVEEDIQRWERWLKGEYFPWDAATSGEDSKTLRKIRKSNK